MAQPPERVLTWLHNILFDYNDTQRTYTDTVRTLSSFPSLSPRTELHTFEDGATSLLLTLSGTLPTTFRGAVYHFPIKLWMPRSYPREAPFLYVTPEKEMQIRPGQHIAIDGRVYHPYIRDWTHIWDRASVVELLGYIQQAFAKEPPVTARLQQSAVARTPTDLPPRPLKVQEVSSPAEMSSSSTPPPRPPKPGEQLQQRDLRVDGPPPPPLPQERPANAQYGGALSYQGRAPTQQASPVLSHGNGWQHRADNVPRPQYAGRPVSYHQEQLANRAMSPPIQHNGFSPVSHGRDASFSPMRQPIPLYAKQAPQGVQQWRSNSHNTRQVAPMRETVTQDLLSDSTDPVLPTNVSIQGPAPPIPPNPERTQLLQALSSTLVQSAQQQLNQNIQALAPLNAQQYALRAAYSRLENELAQLDILDSKLATNEIILRRNIQECDNAIASAKTKQQPPVDDVLVAPTLVAQQLWTVSAEEAACREAMYALQKAMDRGRISGSDFVRQMRALGRECFLKMVLARKCARGMGLEVDK